MDSSSSSITSAGEATEALKSLLNVGKQSMSQSPSETPTVSLQEDIQKLLGLQSDAGEDIGISHDHGDDTGTSQVSNLSNGELLIQDLLSNMSQQQAVTKQQILLQGSDNQNSFSVYGRDVDIIASKHSSTGNSGSNKVQIHPIVNFDWEHKLYTGNLVAVHRNGLHVAYVLRVNSGGIVRVINRKTAERALLKGFRGRVADIAFAHLTALVIGAVDEMGNMFVYEINEDHDGKIDTTLLLSVQRPEVEQTPSDHHRLVWCPFIPEEEESSSATVTTQDSGGAEDASKLLVLTHREIDSGGAEDASKLLVLTHREIAEMWNIDAVVKEYGSGTLFPDDVEEGYVVIDSHTQPIFDASFSPDGTALATASLDGEVKFFQVNLSERSPPRCLYQWKPHDGKPVTSLFFLDDHKTPNPDVQFWKFAITGADNNREMKVWSCESWTCLQSLHFLPPPDMPSNFVVEPCLKVCMDLSASYLVLTDIKRKVLYVAQLYEDRESSRAHVSSISEFLLTQPCLSVAILDAGRKKFKKSADYGGHLLEDVTTEMHEEHEEEEHGKSDGGHDSHITGILLKLCSVHTKALQELRVKFQPETSAAPLHPPPTSLSSVSQDEGGVRDLMSDISMDTVNSELDPTPLMTSSHDLHTPAGKPPTQPMLMTPDSFTSTPGGGYSPRKAGGGEGEPRGPIDSARSSTTIQSNISSLSTLTQVSVMDEDGLRSGRGSLLTSLTSPQSSVTLTPASSRDQSVLDTPSSVPLPPPTPGEEGALASPQGLSVCHAAAIHPEVPVAETPPRGLTRGAGLDEDFMTSSPATRLSRGEFNPPHTSQSDTEDTHRSSDEFFPSATASDAPRPKLGSAESSSSTSLEVREILEGSGSAAGSTKKFMDDHNVEEEEENGTEGDNDSTDLPPDDSPQGRAAQGEKCGGSSVEEEIEEVIEVEPGDMQNDSVARACVFGGGSWPRPPDPPELHQVSLEAQRLATEALHRATTYTIEAHGELAPEQDVDDVCVEEEIDEPGDGAGSHTDGVARPVFVGGVYEDEDDEDKGVRSVAPTPHDPARSGRAAVASHSLEDSEAGDLTKETEDGRQPDANTSELENVSYSSTFSSPTRLLGPPDSQYSRGESHRAYHSATAAAHSVPAVGLDMVRIDQLQDSVQQMLSLLTAQQREIQHLRSELNAQIGATDKLEGLQLQIDSLEGLLTSKVSETLTQHSVCESERLHLALGQRETHDAQKHDALVTTVTQTLDRTLTHKLEKVVKEEIRNHVVPKISSLIEPLAASLHTEMAQKLTATDSLVKDNVAKLIRSRQTVEAMGSAAGKALEGPVATACRDVLIPSFDKACQAMFQQVNGAFQRGTHDYTRQLDGHLETLRHKHEEAREPVVVQLQAMVDAFRAREQANEPVYTQLHNLAGALQAQQGQSEALTRTLQQTVTHAVSGVQEAIMTDMKKLIHDEVVVAMRDQQTTLSGQLMEAMRSTMMTPVPSVTSAPSHTPDPEQQKTDVLHLLRQGQLNQAFQTALSASNLELVLFVCETVNPSQVFNQIPCPLQQPVLLSLIQQLSADLTSHIDLKHHYLQEAVMNLDQTHPITKEHMPAVLGQLCQKLLAHIKTHPQDRSTRSLKMLLMASQSLLK